MTHSAGRQAFSGVQNYRTDDDGGRRGGPGADGRGSGGDHRLPVTAVILLAAGLGVLAGAVGLAPWLVAGMRLPVQNLWASETLPDDMPLSLLPLSQYLVFRLVALLTVGGLVAGLGLRWWDPVRRRPAVVAVMAGLLLVQVWAAVQSFSVLNEGLAPATLSRWYADGLLAGTLATIVAAVLVACGLASRRKGPAALGIGVASLPAGDWLAAWAEAAWPPFALPGFVPVLAQWFPVLLVGLALAWCTPDRLGRVAVWIADLALLWTVPVLVSAVSGALGTRLFRGDVTQMQPYAAAIIRDGLASPVYWGPVLLAAGVGVAGAVVLRAAGVTVRR